MAAMSAKFKISRVGRTISRWVADDEIIKKEHLKVKLASEYALAELCMLIAICDRMVDHPPTYAEAKHNSHDRQALELDVQTARALDALTRLGNKLERLGQLSGCSNMELYEAEERVSDISQDLGEIASLSRGLMREADTSDADSD